VVDLGQQAAFVEAVLQEARHQTEGCGRFDTLYLGGGTPSVLSRDRLAALVDGLRRNLPFAKDTEITLEANPDDVRVADVRLWTSLGINRVSVGAQSFDDDELGFLGRRHSALDALRALELVRAHGPQNLSIDLIYGFYGQDRAVLAGSLQRALSFAPEHLSCYQLTLEPRTTFGRRHARGELRRASEEAERSAFLFVSEAIRACGFDHYEISNFARTPLRRSRHNQKYWLHVETIGLGPAAHSYRDRRRWWNVSTVRDYVARVHDGGDATASSEQLTEEQVQLETLLLGLRTANGVTLEFVKKLPRGMDIVATIAGEGLVSITEDRVVPTLEGYLVADGLPLRFEGK
jgi:oxygen-independent coproporphyrinogen-3 oxidase